MARKTRNQKRSADLPGTIYLNKNRYWWKVRLPGEEKTRARPLNPIGSRYATTDYAVAVECAKHLLQEHLFQKDITTQGDVHTISDLVQAYMTFAKEYYVDPNGNPTQDPKDRAMNRSWRENRRDDPVPHALEYRCASDVGSDGAVRCDAGEYTVRSWDTVIARAGPLLFTRKGHA